ncbi:hypothetical protein IP84_00775 [beta proteobacterium AAP99]|nr:hypothetical protein IP84_00775 [beta proteobacterium AAP99]
MTGERLAAMHHDALIPQQDFAALRGECLASLRRRYDPASPSYVPGMPERLTLGPNGRKKFVRAGEVRAHLSNLGKQPAARGV